MNRLRGRAIFAAALFATATSLAPTAAAATAVDAARGGLVADLDGIAIKLGDVGKYFCHDFAYPRIHCFSTADNLQTSVQVTLSTSSVTYVTMYDLPAFAGSFMYVSQDYTILASIGWNDRVSSFIVRNGLDGHFYTDWFYGGTSYYFCCGQQAGSLGSYDNIFSSVHLH